MGAPQRRFAGQVAWVTGAGSGIGRATALRLAEEGASVALSGRRRAQLESTAAAIEAAGGRALVVPCDVTNEAEVVAAVESVRTALGRIDVVIASAGYSVTGRFETLSLEDWRRQFDVNVFGVVATARHALSALRDTRGRLVLVGSASAFLPAAGIGPYAASKSAVRAIGDTLAIELAGTGVSCTTVHPGYVESDIDRVDNQNVHHPDRTDRRPAHLMWTGDRAADAILDAAYRRKRERVFTRHGQLAAAVGRHVPQLPMALMQRANRRKAARRSQQAGGAGSRKDGDTGGERTLPIGTPVTVEFTPRPLPLLYARGLALGVRRRQGQLPPGVDGFAGLVVELHGVRLGRTRITAWQAVCGDETRPDRIPLCLPEALFLSPMGRILTDRAFPLSPLGLIHIGQRIVLHHALSPDEALDLRCRIAEARFGPRGIEIDVAMHVESSGTLKWEGTATMLSRAPGVRGGRKGDEPPASTWEHAADVEIPEDTGRRYARVSDDWNPHHLWRASARLIGFKRPIAHGMWTLARMVGEMGAAVPADRPVDVEARFKRPILMPALVRFAWSGSLDETNGIRFEVRGAETGEVHLVGNGAAPGRCGSSGRVSAF
jgi:NAD(P)-dependent dehydrogenase (short-subunit alcohol dehydrogenase family)/acyl dehydratase